jgi:6-pyruvoyltetrahydropterin/6-carboxytetrahydropterin synthase
MYRLKVIDQFSSAHQLKGYRGECEELHGHNWKVEVFVEGEKLDSVGLLIDFKELKKLIRTITGELDHRFLNAMEPFKKSNPSSELISKHIYSELKNKLPSGVSLDSVAVWESETACAVYSE